MKLWSLVEPGAHVGSSIGGEDLSSAPIVLERDDLIGKRFADNRPTPTMLDAQQPCPSAPTPSTKIPDTMDSDVTFNVVWQASIVTEGRFWQMFLTCQRD